MFLEGLKGGVFSKNIINIKSYFKNVRIRSPQKNFKKGKNVIDEFLENTSLPIFFIQIQMILMEGPMKTQ